MAEMWRAVPGYEGYYEVSNVGRVRSLPRTVQTMRGAWRLSGRVMAPRIDTRGYPAVALRKAGGRKSFCVHRLVAMAFLPPPAASFLRQVAHLDGTRTNNRVENLKWASNAENSHHKRWHGTHQSGEMNPRAKLTVAAVLSIRSSQSSSASLARRFGVNESAIRKIRKGYRWRQSGDSETGASPEQDDAHA